MKRARIKPLLEWIPLATPRFAPPVHLAPLTALLERTRREEVRAVVHAPPRHGKSETIWHGIAWLLLQQPALSVGYVTYAQRFSEKRSRRGRELARHVGVSLAGDASSKTDWRTGVDDGGVWATSISGAITGEGFKLIIVDDPVKDRATAESALEREKAYEWFNDVAFTRLEPGASCIVLQTRWHEDDLAGRLIADGWEHVRLPAIDDDGRALWPARYNAEKLREIREQLGEYAWSSLYQGEPRPRGDQLFGDVVFYDELPSGDGQCGIGVDLAYTEKKTGDYSVAVVVVRLGDLTYVVDVVRAQMLAPAFAARLVALRMQHPTASWRAYLAGTEKGVADFFTSTFDLALGAMRPNGDKFVRAQPVAAAWNAGKVLLPRRAPWLNAFVDELKSFSGVKDPHDDQVDALAAAFDVADTGRFGGEAVIVASSRGADSFAFSNRDYRPYAPTADDLSIFAHRRRHLGG